MKSKQKIAGAWVPRRLEMLRSPAWRALSGPAKGVIERLEIEHMTHGGKDNGQLICTHRDFGEHGIRYPSVAPAIRQGVNLGFVEITRPGWRSANHGRAAQYRLTYLPVGNSAPTDEWKQISPNARRPLKHNPAAKPHRKNHKLGYENVSTGSRYDNVSTGRYENVSTEGPKPGYENVSTIYNSIQSPPAAGPEAEQPKSRQQVPAPTLPSLSRLRSRLMSTTRLPYCALDMDTDRSNVATTALR